MGGAFPEDIKDEWEKLQNQKSKDYSKASESKITSPEQDQKKIDTLNAIIDERTGPLRQLTEENSKKIDTLIQDVANIANFLQQAQGQAQQNQTYAVNNNKSLQDLPPDVKADLLSKVGTSIAQIIQAWKGSNPNNPHNDIYGEMFKQMGLDIVQAGLDGIKQQIYPQFVPQPRPTNYLDNVKQVPRGKDIVSGFR